MSFPLTLPVWWSITLSCQPHTSNTSNTSNTGIFFFKGRKIFWNKLRVFPVDCSWRPDVSTEILLNFERIKLMELFQDLVNMAFLKNSLGLGIVNSGMRDDDDKFSSIILLHEKLSISLLCKSAQVCKIYCWKWLFCGKKTASCMVI